MGGRWTRTELQIACGCSRRHYPKRRVHRPLSTSALRPQPARCTTRPPPPVHHPRSGSRPSDWLVPEHDRWQPLQADRETFCHRGPSRTLRLRCHPLQNSKELSSQAGQLGPDREIRYGQVPGKFRTWQPLSFWSSCSLIACCTDSIASTSAVGTESLVGWDRVTAVAVAAAVTVACAAGLELSANARRSFLCMSTFIADALLAHCLNILA
ncbi:hypothetical protein ANO11243_038070 [Dothideomycetidae sp. 11243]|nr:hypothetical protein ANO11243_038070 [fungal sp. No.11243]